MGYWCLTSLSTLLIVLKVHCILIYIKQMNSIHTYFSILSKLYPFNYKKKDIGLCCLTPLSTIFLLYYGCQFHWRRIPEYPKKSTDLPQFTDKLYFFILFFSIVRILHNPYVHHHLTKVSGFFSKNIY